MLIPALIVGLIGIFAMMDSRLLGRLNFEQPLITSTLVGLMLGDLQKGLIVGATLELMSIGIVSIGAAVPSDMVLASIIASAFTVLSGASAQQAIAIAVPIGILGQLLGIVMRMSLAGLTHAADKAIEDGNFKLARSYHIVWGTVIYALVYFIPIFVVIFFGTGVVKTLVAMIPAWLTNGLNLASKLLPAYGFALLMSTMLSKKNAVYLLIGFFATAYGNLSVTAIAIFAVLLVLVMNELMPKKNETEIATQSSSNTSDDLDDLEEL